MAGPPEARLDEVANLAPPARHAIEVAVMRELTGDAVLAALMAARTAALFASLERDAQAFEEPWHATMAAPLPPREEDLGAVWSVLQVDMPRAPSLLDPRSARRLADVWCLLGPVEYLMGTGGDPRIGLDPETGLNAYGCSPRPRPWAITFASSTASSISERGYAGAEIARRRLLANALEHGAEAAIAIEVRAIRHALSAFYGLAPGTEVVIAPSGTDGELFALAVSALGAPGDPIGNVLVAPEESGTGVPLAAVGRHFARTTARGVSVVAGERIAGFPADAALVTVAARTAEGAVRPPSEVDAECAAKVRAERARGRRVLLHVMDQTKTGLVVPGDVTSIVGASSDAEQGVDVVVDACQARISVESVRAYLDRGFMVLVTGSKFFTGPPFAGALLLPPRIASRLFGAAALPSGLADYSGRFDWPEGAPASAAFSGAANVGLAMRWAAAGAEMDAFAKVGEPAIHEILTRFRDRVRAAILASPDLCLHPAPMLRRARAQAWDALPTIFPFSLRPFGAPRALDLAEAKEIYSWLNADVSAALPLHATPAERALAARLVHLGQPVAIATESGAVAGALRICAGARLVSGEPSQAGLAAAARLEREIDDALSGLAKVALLLRYRDAIRAAVPPPRATFRG